MNKSEKMFAIVSGFDASGLDRAAYCARHDISISVFAYWRSKWLRRSKTGEATPSASLGKFVPIEPLPPSLGLASGGELIYPNGLRLRLAQLDVETVTAFVKAYV